MPGRMRGAGMGDVLNRPPPRSGASIRTCARKGPGMSGRSSLAAGGRVLVGRSVRTAGQADGARFRIWLDQRFSVFAIAPTVLLMLVVFGVPLAFSFYLSTQGWTIDQSLFAGSFAGVQNYMDLF